MNNASALRTCAICGKPVPLESAKADEHGRPVHEQCYVSRLKDERTKPAKN